MPILNLQFKSNNTQSFLDLAETLQVCSTVAKHLEHGQRLDNLKWRLSHVQSRQSQPKAKNPIRFTPFLRNKNTFTVSALRSTLEVPYDDLVPPRADDSLPTYEFVPSSPRPPPRRRLSSPPPPIYTSYQQRQDADETDSDDSEDYDGPESPVRSPSPPPLRQPRLRPSQAPTPRALNAALRTPNATPNAPTLAVKAECANCGATQTPLWRRGLNDELNCNACGLYCKMHKRPRPLKNRVLKVEVEETPAAASGDTKAECINCRTTNTPLWRRDEEGRSLCNACGLYFKLHGASRPISLKSDVIKKRSRPGLPPKKSSPPQKEFIQDFERPSDQPPPPPSASSESESEDFLCIPFPGPYHPSRIFALARKRKPVGESPLGMGALRLRKQLRL